MPFINGQIPPEKQEEFVMHMKNCPKCHEELEVYYILLNGMKHLDSNEKLPANPTTTPAIIRLQNIRRPQLRTP